MESTYRSLQQHLDSFPNGFPASESGVELEILKRIFTEEEASVFMKLKLVLEPLNKIAERTGHETEYLEKILAEMKNKGQVLGVSIKNTLLYKALPYIFGIYELQLHRIDTDMAKLFEKYNKEAFVEEFYTKSPSLLKVVPIGIEIKDDTKIEPYESVAAMIEGAKTWAVRDCICKTEKSLLGHKCDNPIEVCLSFASVEHIYDNDPSLRVITKEEAYAVMEMAEKAGLVHMTSNFKDGQFFICNCCSCCCELLSKYITVSKHATAKSNYIATVDTGECISCGACVDRCQVKAIEINEYATIKDCIGCGVCVSACPTGAIKMMRRESSDTLYLPANEKEWMKLRAEGRGMGDGYKKHF